MTASNTTTRVPITKKGLENIKNELAKLKAKSLEITDAIEDALRHGDLSENAEYQSAREQQDINSSRISSLENVIASSEVVDPSALSGNVVKFGATVVLLDQNDKEFVYQLVGESEASIDAGLLSCTSPIGIALINQKKGSFVSVNLPSGEKIYKIVDVRFE